MKSLKGKKRGLSLIVFSILFQLSGVFAQSFGFRYNQGYGSTGVSSAISNVFDIIFGGIVGPFFDAINFNFYGATKLALWIILYLLLSHGLKKVLGKDGMHNKFSKVIAAIIALLSVAFISPNLLDLVFRDILGGLVGFLLLAAAVALPIYYLFKWSSDNADNRAVNLLSALMFFLLIIVFSELNNQFMSVFNYGFMQTITSLLLAFGVITALILCIQRAYLGFKGMGGNSEAHEERRPAEREDEFAEVKSLANNLIGAVNNLRQNIHNVSDVPETLAKELLHRQDRLNFVNIPSIHNLNQGIVTLSNQLNKIKGKNKNKASQSSAKITHTYNGLHDALDNFAITRRRLSHYLSILNAALRGGAAPDYGYFGDLIGRLRNIDANLKSLAGALAEVQHL